ncbi:MAG: MFS transporter [Bifidobacteriaceae bacterium]|nr:MFS transporter [Bifidobacteriaceae bacterium]
MVILGLNLRAAVTTVPPLLDRIQAEVQLSPAAVSLIAAAPPLMFAIFGSLAPFLGRRWGLERVIAGAMAVGALGMGLRALTSSEFIFLVGTGAAMAGLGGANVAVPPLIKRYFPDRIGLMTTASTLFLVAGQALPPAIAVPLADQVGWRWAAGIWAVGAALAALPWFVQPYRLSRRQRGKKTARPRLGPIKVTTSYVFWGITGLLICNSAAAYALIGWLPRIMTDAGASAHRGAVWLTIFTAGSLLPAMVVPALTIRLRRPWLLIVTMYLSWTVGLVGLWLWPLHGTAWWIALTRIGDGNYACAITLMNLRTRTSQTVLTVSGLAQAIAYTVAAAATFAFGQLQAFSGSWHWPFILLICTMPLGLAGGLLASRQTYVEDQVARTPSQP